MAVSVLGGPLSFDAVIADSNFSAQIRRIEQQLQGITRTAEKEASSIENLIKKTTVAIGAYASFSAGTNFIGDIVRVRGEFQQLEVAFTTMLGSKEKADTLLAQATELAAKTPFTLQDVGSGAKQLLAYGFAAETITGNLSMLGNIASGVGAPLNDIVYLYGTLQTQGRAYTKDIMQFTGRGIPIVAELAKQFGVTKEEVTGLVEAGKVGFPQIEKAFQSMTNEGGMFFNLMEEQSKTLTGQISNLQDAWSRMLNDIGKSGEGVFSSAIQAAIGLVNNYQTVLDILKVLVITYGAYRAAIIATTAIQAIATNMAKGYTLAETLRYQAMLLSEKAMKLLNRTMLSNPAVLITTGIVALVSALVIFSKSANEAKSSTELLAEAAKTTGDSFAETKAKIQPYVDALKNANISEQERVNIYEKLKAIDPEIVKGLDAKTLSYDKLSASVDAYLTNLRKQIRLETNKEATVLSIKQEEKLKEKIKAYEKRIKESDAKVQKATDSESRGLAQYETVRLQGLIKTTNADLAAQVLVTKELGNEQVSTEKKVQDEKTNTVAVTKESAKALKKANDEQKQHLEELNRLLEEITNAEADARRSGLLKEESEIDRINQRYDELKKKAQSLKAEPGVFARIENARKTQVGNTREREDYKEFVKSIDSQKKAFDDFEQYKLDVGKNKAMELTKFQTDGFENYLDFLKRQLDAVNNDQSLKVNFNNESQRFEVLANQNSLNSKLKREFLANAITDAENEQARKDLDRQIDRIKQVTDATQTYAQKKLAIEKKYLEDVAIIRQNFSGQEQADRETVLANARQDELDSLNSQLLRESELYRRLNQDTLTFTKDRIKQEIKYLQDKLKTDKSLSPQQIAAINAVIAQYTSVVQASTKIIIEASKAASALQSASGVFSSLSNTVRAFNGDIADSLQTMSDLAEIASLASSAMADFAKADKNNPEGYIAGITSIVQALGKMVESFSRAAQSKKDADKQVADFQQQLIAGEIEYNAMIRERQRSQVTLNKLTLDGLRDQRKLLLEQKDLAKKTYDELFAKLQGETYVTGQNAKSKKSLSSAITGGLLGFLGGGSTSVKDITASLAGKSFEELEKLFAKGQLTGNAKALFEQLQKIKQEGLDLDALLADNAQKLREALTGTTAQSITDSIIEGFRNGQRGAADFADSFQSLMQNAMLQSLKLKYLEGPLKDFFDEFATATESDGQLTNTEIAALQQAYNAIINNATLQFEQLQNVAGISFNAAGGQNGGNSLAGAIKGITQEQANLLAGQFGGLRSTAFDQLNVARQSLTVQQNIELNTGRLLALWERVVIDGLKVI